MKRKQESCVKSKQLYIFILLGNNIIVICITRLENAILQVQVRFVEQRRQPRRTSASTCKTFSSRVIHKIFSADNLFKAKYNNFC
jgi:hypothetical protein